MSIDLITEIVQELNAGTGFRDMVEAVHLRLRDRIPCNRMAVALFDPLRDRLTLHACRSDGPVLLREGYGAPVKGSTLEALLKTGEARILNDLEAYLEANPGSESTRLIVREGFRSSLSLPLIARGRPIGVLFFSSRNAGAYNAEHVELCRLVAGHISVALERSLLSEELRSSKEYLENILENSADAIIVTDRADRILSWNRGAERMLGWRADEMIGRLADSLLPADRRASGEPGRIREIVDREGFLAGHETECLARDGRRLQVNLTMTAIRSRDGAIIGRSSILRDLTHQLEMQEELVRTRSLATLGEMAASVAHEIKNPLAGISGAIQVIAGALDANDPRREIMGEVIAQVRRLDRTVRDLLVFARPWKPELQPVDLVDLLERAAVLLRQEPRMKEIAIRLEGPESVRLEADPGLLQEVLVNLVHNAADAMPSGGLIRLVAGAENGCATLHVVDDGTGIPPEVREKLFRPFFTTKTRGTGLGLAISKKIVDAHGGRMEIGGVPGKGTDVGITLPKEPGHGAPRTDR